ncbi:tRNA pseudouridine synthase B [Bifidobacterium stellenboschense]|uniref:tRNA pseudouridine synthase B n=1 Tax=Bifidobacterium stellenboschense TaxID=762211 RepID=A0A087D7Z1_9BIFI|nr:tRNA pseudouridine(55) synthase TruB [Bifidobacterium stellenboschense]KFI91641.1 tRNA pseudouridine synthase B [Bifidobacterium stellenboschense]
MTNTTCADGLLIVDKPQGVTSFDAVAAVRAALHTKKVGHAGTLDPMATGMLVIGFGRATRLLQYIVEHDKTYEATIRLGLATTTDDAEGDIVAPDTASLCSRWRELSAEPTEGGHPDVSDDAARLRAIIESTIAERFTGDIEQIPNTFSAIKIDGQRAYDLARAGKDVALKARPVHIAEFTVLATREGLASTSDPASPLQSAPTSRSRNGGDSRQSDPTSRSRWRELSAEPTEGGSEGVSESARFVPVIDVDVRVSCSSGTYIRALARDLGEVLGVGGYLTRLRRTRVGRFALSDDRSGLAQTTVLPAVTDAGIGDDTPGTGETATEAAETTPAAMQAIAAHIEPKTFTNRDGETVTRNRCVLDTPGEARGDWLRARAVGMADAARGAMPVADITADEARELRFGRRINRELEKGVHYAAIVPATRGGIGDAAGAVVPADVAAIIERANRTQAKPAVVFPTA